MICPICGFNGIFQPYGSHQLREYAKCPQCKSLERKRLLYFILKNELQVFDMPEKYNRILHFSPSFGIFQLFNDNPNYKAVDISPNLYSFGPIERFNICSDIYDIHDGSFDLIINFHVLEHVKCDYIEVLTQFRRILSNHGILVLCVPFKGDFTVDELDKKYTEDERRSQFGGADHIRMFGRMDFPLVLNSIFPCSYPSQMFNRLTQEQIEIHNIVDSRIDICNKKISI